MLHTVATGSGREIEIGTADAPVRPTRGSLQFAPDGSRLLIAGRDAEGSRGLYFVHLATGETEPVLLPADDDASELQDLPTVAVAMPMGFCSRSLASSA